MYVVHSTCSTCSTCTRTPSLSQFWNYLPVKNIWTLFLYIHKNSWKLRFLVACRTSFPIGQYKKDNFRHFAVKSCLDQAKLSKIVIKFNLGQIKNLKVSWIFQAANSRSDGVLNIPVHDICAQIARAYLFKGV